MKRAHFFLIILLLSVYHGFSQYSPKNNSTKLDADYYLMIREYDKALKLYLSVLKSEPQNADMKYKIGICYLNTENERKNAIPYLEEAVKSVNEKYNPGSFKEMGAPIDAYFILGSAYRIDNQLDKALAAYNAYAALIDPRDEYSLQIADQYIKSCIRAKEMLMNPADLTMTNLGETINDAKSSFNPVVSGDGKTLVFTSSGMTGYDIFYSTMVDGSWSEPKNITSSFGVPGRKLKTTGISNDGTTLYLVFEDPFNSDIYTSTLSRGRWSKAEMLDKPVNSKANETHASISSDGNTLYFTSNRTGGEGDLDIYMTTLGKKGKWTKPVNLGPRVNTFFNEESPFISADGKTLYFSSEGHDGMGGYDIFRIDLTEPGAEAVNLGFPVNTTDNNYFYLPVSDGSVGYYAYSGADSYGGKDIYLVESGTQMPASVLVKGFIHSDTLIVSPPLPDFLVQITDMSTGRTVDEFTVQIDRQEFTRSLPPGSYQISVSADEFVPCRLELNIPPAYYSPEMTVEAYMVYADREKKQGDLLAEGFISGGERQETETEMDKADYQAVTSFPEGSRPVNIPEATVVMDASEKIVSAAGSEPRDEPVVVATPVSPAVLQKDSNEMAMSAVPGQSGQIQSQVSEVAQQPGTVEKEGEDTPLASVTYVMEGTDAGRGIDNLNASMPVILPDGVARAYTVQLMALRKPVKLSYFKGLKYVTVTYTKDKWYRYTIGNVTDPVQAEKLKNELVAMGYTDAFIRKKYYVPNYTIQVMAVPGPVVDLTRFDNLTEISATQGEDIFCRYTTGEYELLNVARTTLAAIKPLGYDDAFVRRKTW